MLGFLPLCIPTSAKVPPTGADWLHEPKLDGYRGLVTKDGRDVRIYTRGGYDWSKRLPAVAAAFLELPCRAAILDGELCVPDARGVPDFRGLRTATSHPHDARLVFFAFDLLHRDGVDLRGLPLVERKRRLARLADRAALPCLFPGRAL